MKNTKYLDDEVQEQVDKIIHEHGIAGLGYYYIYTYCTNCCKRGITMYKLGTEKFTKGVVCVKCRVSDCVITREE